MQGWEMIGAGNIWILDGVGGLKRDRLVITEWDR